MIEWWAVMPAVAAALLLWKARHNFARLPELAQRASGEADVTVIVPARNEAASISRVVGSFPPGTVIVVDDESSDGTALEAEQAGALVLPAPKLLRGWIGKSNACWAASLTAPGRWLLFVDADTGYAPEFLASLIAYAEDRQLGVASVLPRMEFRGWGIARLVAPFAQGLSFCGVDTGQIYHAKNPQPLLSGQCLLMRRDAYDFLGGHKVVAAHLDEAAALARVLRRHRVKAHLLRGGALAHAVIRHAARRRLLPFPVDGAAGWLQVLLACVLTLAWLPCAVWLWIHGARAGAIVAAATMAAAWWSWYGGPFRAIGVLPGSYLFLCVAAWRLLRAATGGRRRWKGRLV